MLNKKTFTKTAPHILCIQVQDFNISDIFYKIQNLKKWKMKAVVPFCPRNLKLHSPLKENQLPYVPLPSGGLAFYEVVRQLEVRGQRESLDDLSWLISFRRPTGFCRNFTCTISVPPIWGEGGIGLTLGHLSISSLRLAHFILTPLDEQLLSKNWLQPNLSNDLSSFYNIAVYQGKDINLGLPKTCRIKERRLQVWQ